MLRTKRNRVLISNIQVGYEHSIWSEWRDLNSRLPLAVPEIRSSRYRSANFDRCAFALLAVSAAGSARRQSLTRGSRGRLEPPPAQSKEEYRQAVLLFAWSEWRDLNSRPLDPQSSALPTAPHPDMRLRMVL